MAIRIDGKAVSAQVRARVAGEVAALREKGVVPGLAVIIVGDDPPPAFMSTIRKRPARRWASVLRSSRSRQIRRSCN